MVVPTPVGEAPRPSRGQAPVNGTCDWYNMGCQPGCSECNPKCGHAAAAFGLCCKAAQDFKPTNNDMKYRTYQDLGGVIDVGMRHNPWRAPGFAPVDEPCGILAGDQPGEYVIGGPEPGTRGSTLPELPGGRDARVSWPAGSKQEVSWSLYANHGGGYAYRLCNKADSDNTTEACFQRNHLPFVGDISWIQYGGDALNRSAINATRLSEGTNPPGSQWTRNPIPACAGDVGGAGTPIWIPGLSWCRKTQFEAPLADVIPPHHRLKPLPGLYGFGLGAVGPVLFEKDFEYWTDLFNFNIVDLVEIPADLPPGDYVLSFRWDCEQTPQIWSQCADVTITAPVPLVV
jgi:hypothetical protein